MKKQLRGIALILVGIFLAIVSVAAEPSLAGDIHLLWSIAGGVCEGIGLLMVFDKE